jgi:hypothetical protein
MVKGIGPDFAKQLAGVFGDRAFDMTVGKLLCNFPNGVHIIVHII